MTAPRSTLALVLVLPLAVAGRAQETRPALVHAAPAPLSKSALTEDWPCLLGPRRDGVCRETRLRKDFGETGPPLVFEVPKGAGYSPPALVGSRLFLFHRLGDEEVLECRDAENGTLQFEDRHATTYRDSFGYSNGPRASPVVAGDRVFRMGAQGVLTANDARSGERLWQRDLMADYQVPQDFFGVVSTPLATEDRLFVHVGAPEGPCVVALDAGDGHTIWTANSDWLAGYSSPVLASFHGEDRLLVFAGGESRPPRGGLLGLDPATGAIDLRFPWRSRAYASVNAANPVVIGERIFVSSSYDTGGALLRVTEDFEALPEWTSPVLGTHFATAIAHEGHLYGIDGRNEPDTALVCQDLETGAEVWREVLEWEETYRSNGVEAARPLGVYRGNLLQVDGAFLCLGEWGHLLWLDLRPEGCRVLARHWLFPAQETWTPPVVHRGLLYVCQNSRSMIDGSRPRLLCYDLRLPARSDDEDSP